MGAGAEAGVDAGGGAGEGACLSTLDDDVEAFTFLLLLPFCSLVGAGLVLACRRWC